MRVRVRVLLLRGQGSGRGRVIKGAGIKLLLLLQREVLGQVQKVLQGWRVLRVLRVLRVKTAVWRLLVLLRSVGGGRAAQGAAVLQPPQR